MLLVPAGQESTDWACRHQPPVNAMPSPAPSGRGTHAVHNNPALGPRPPRPWCSSLAARSAPGAQPRPDHQDHGAHAVQGTLALHSAVRPCTVHSAMRPCTVPSVVLHWGLGTGSPAARTMAPLFSPAGEPNRQSPRWEDRPGR